MKRIFRERHGLMERRCSRCRRYKILGLFKRFPTMPHGVSSWCRKCSAIENRKYKFTSADRRLSESLILGLVRDGQMRVDSKGRFWRMFARRSGGWVRVRETRCDSAVSRGYRCVNQKIGGVRYSAAAHRIVYMIATGSVIAPELQINHRNGIRDDNRPANLEVTTCLGNIRHALAHGLRRRRLTDDDVREIRRRVVDGEMQRDVGNAFGIAHNFVSQIVNYRKYAWVDPDLASTTARCQSMKLRTAKIRGKAAA